MKLRLVMLNQEPLIYCFNGSNLSVTPETLVRLMRDFKAPNSFKGNAGRWNDTVADMQDCPGLTLAIVDDHYHLVIYDGGLFASLMAKTVYISASEYAEKHGKCRASIKRMCDAGRIEGAYKTSSGWLIPADSPYPARKEREVKAKV